MMTSLVIPKFFRDNINPYSGRLHGIAAAQKTAKGLFFSPENEKFLASVLPALCANRAFVSETLLNIEETAAPGILGPDLFMTGADAGSADQRGLIVPKTNAIIKAMTVERARISLAVPELMGEFPQPYKEDTFTANPVMQLHHMNKAFLLQAAKNIVGNPDSIVPDFYDHNPETGNDESGLEYDYSSASYADGTWHPEHLFTNSGRNKANPYWIPRETNFISESGEEGLGHHFYNSATGGVKSATDIVVGPLGEKPHSGGQTYISIHNNDRPRTSGWIDGPTAYAHNQRTRSQFPRWQAAGMRRQLDLGGEGYREGGISDRRVQRPHGYNTGDLVYQSAY